MYGLQGKVWYFFFNKISFNVNFICIYLFIYKYLLVLFECHFLKEV